MNTPEESTKSKKSVQRSSAYPAFNLQDSITFVGLVKKNSGDGPFSRLSAVQGMEHDKITGTSGAKVAALVHFGLFEKSNDTYRISQLANRILVETSQEDKDLAIKEAVSQPKLYKQLIERYRNFALPLLLKNILSREYGIIEKVAPEAAKIFVKSLTFAGILTNGIVTDSNDSKIPESQNEDPSNPKLEENNHSKKQDNLILPNQQDSQKTEINLSNGKAVLFLPPILTHEDGKKLKGLVDIFVTNTGGEISD